MGAFFIGGQIYEYAELVHEGLTIASSPYGSVFYLTTGFHGLHVVGGLIAFLFLLGRSFTAKRFGHHEATTAIVDVVLLALRRRRVDRAVRRHLPAEVEAAGAPAHRLVVPYPPRARRGSIREGTRSPQAGSACADRAAPAGAAAHRWPVRGAGTDVGRRDACAGEHRRHRDRREAVPGQLRLLPRTGRVRHGERPVPDRRGRGRCRLPGRHRSDAHADERTAGAGQAGPVRPGPDQPARRVRRVAGRRPRHPHGGAGRPRARRRRPTAC